jgi:hypothetical protein
MKRNLHLKRQRNGTLKNQICEDAHENRKRLQLARLVKDTVPILGVCQKEFTSNGLIRIVCVRAIIENENVKFRLPFETSQENAFGR